MGENLQLPGWEVPGDLVSLKDIRLHTPIKLARFVFCFLFVFFLYGATTETAQSLELGGINSNLDGESSSSV